MVRSSSRRRAKRNKMTATCGQKELIASPTTSTTVEYHDVNSNAAGDVPQTLKNSSTQNNGEAILESFLSKREIHQYWVYAIGALIVAIICALLIDNIFPYPSYASCTVQWRFEDPCTCVMQKFRTQMLNWVTCNTCGSHGRRCRYMLKIPKQNEDNIIRAKHYNMDFETVQNIEIMFEQANNSCSATGTSKSSEWFIIFDNGINYCNLRNLVSCTGFDKHKGFLELTSDTTCTQYNMAIC